MEIKSSQLTDLSSYPSTKGLKGRHRLYYSFSSPEYQTYIALRRSIKELSTTKGNLLGIREFYQFILWFMVQHKVPIGQSIYAIDKNDVDKSGNIRSLVKVKDIMCSDLGDEDLKERVGYSPDNKRFCEDADGDICIYVGGNLSKVNKVLAKLFAQLAKTEDLSSYVLHYENSAEDLDPENPESSDQFSNDETQEDKVDQEDKNNQEHVDVKEPSSNTDNLDNDLSQDLLKFWGNLEEETEDEAEPEEEHTLWRKGWDFSKWKSCSRVRLRELYVREERYKYRGEEKTRFIIDINGKSIKITQDLLGLKLKRQEFSIKTAYVWGSWSILEDNSSIIAALKICGDSVKTYICNLRSEFHGKIEPYACEECPDKLLIAAGKNLVIFDGSNGEYIQVETGNNIDSLEAYHNGSFIYGTCTPGIGWLSYDLSYSYFCNENEIPIEEIINLDSIDNTIDEIYYRTIFPNQGRDNVMKGDNSGDDSEEDIPGFRYRGKGMASDLDVVIPFKEDYIIVQGRKTELAAYDITWVGELKDSPRFREILKCLELEEKEEVRKKFKILYFYPYMLDAVGFNKNAFLFACRIGDPNPFSGDKIEYYICKYKHGILKDDLEAAKCGKAAYDYIQKAKAYNDVYIREGGIFLCITGNETIPKAPVFPTDGSLNIDVSKLLAFHSADKHLRQSISSDKLKNLAIFIQDRACRGSSDSIIKKRPILDIKETEEKILEWVGCFTDEKVYFGYPSKQEDGSLITEDRIKGLILIMDLSQIRDEQCTVVKYWFHNARSISVTGNVNATTRPEWYRKLGKFQKLENRFVAYFEDVCSIIPSLNVPEWARITSDNKGYYSTRSDAGIFSWIQGDNRKDWKSSGHFGGDVLEILTRTDEGLEDHKSPEECLFTERFDIRITTDNGYFELPSLSKIRAAVLLEDGIVYANEQGAYYLHSSRKKKRLLDNKKICGLSYQAHEIKIYCCDHFEKIASDVYSGSDTFGDFWHDHYKLYCNVYSLKEERIRAGLT